VLLVLEGRGVSQRCYLPPDTVTREEIARIAHDVRGDVNGSNRLYYGDYQRPEQMDAAERALLAQGFARAPLGGLRIAPDRSGTLRAGHLTDLGERLLVLAVRCDRPLAGVPWGKSDRTYVFVPPAIRWKRATDAIRVATERHAARLDALPPATEEELGQWPRVRSKALEDDVRAIYRAVGLCVVDAIIDR
jgi:hypothetical protein